MYPIYFEQYETLGERYSSPLFIIQPLYYNELFVVGVVVLKRSLMAKNMLEFSHNIFILMVYNVIHNVVV